MKLDLRNAAVGRAGFGREASNVSTFIAQGLFYFVLGAILAIFVSASRDLFLTGTVLLTYTLFMVGTTVLLDHNSALTSPTDYHVLGFRPVSSRTYFAVKLANVLVYTTAMTTLVVLLPVLSLVLRHGVLVGLAGLIACYACSISAALVILTAYAWLMRIAGAEALKHALSYVQLVMSFFVYGGYLLMSRFMSRGGGHVVRPAENAVAAPLSGDMVRELSRDRRRPSRTVRGRRGEPLGRRRPRAGVRSRRPVVARILGTPRRDRQRQPAHPGWRNGVASIPLSRRRGPGDGAAHPRRSSETTSASG